jgi:transcriptional regulator with XRE-family HTH domain
MKKQKNEKGVAMSNETEKKKPKTAPKKRIESKFSYWLDEQLLHGEASELAAALGVAVSTVTYWRQGRNIPTLEHCRQIAQHLNVEPEFVENMVQEARNARHHANLAEKEKQEKEESTQETGED